MKIDFIVSGLREVLTSYFCLSWVKKFSHKCL